MNNRFTLVSNSYTWRGGNVPSSCYASTALLRVYRVLAIACVAAFSQASLASEPVAACDDFYRHVCDPILEHPGSRSVYTETGEAARQAVLKMLAADTINPELDRLRTFYQSCMVTAADTRRHEIIKTWVRRIDGIETKRDMWRVVLEFHRYGVYAFFQYIDEQDRQTRGMNRGRIQQASYGLRLYQFEDSTIINAYRNHIRQMMEIVGIEPKMAEIAAEKVVHLETILARSSPSPYDVYDAGKSEHPMFLDQLYDLAESVPWEGYLQLVGNPTDRQVNVVNKGYLRTVEQVIVQQPIESLKAYLLWRWIDTLAADLSPDLEAAQRSFRQYPNEPQEDVCVLKTVKAMGVQLSRQFAIQVIGQRARDGATLVTRSIQEAAVEAVGSRDWLTPDGAKRTAKKVQMTSLKIGYPEDWPEVGSYRIGDSYLSNALVAREFEERAIWRRAQSSRNRDSWEMRVSPNQAPGIAAARLTIVNGYPDAFSNSIIIPAASLLPPMFDINAPVGRQFGGFGNLIGHEISHVLDNPQYDELGAPSSLWKEADHEAYHERQQCVADQANDFEVLDGVYLDGTKTMNENVADLGGIEITYRALVKTVGDVHAVKNGVSAAQEFFIGYAEFWCSNEVFKPIEGRYGHSPSRYRVNGPLSNFPEFQKAFSCPSDSRMVRSKRDRCTIWQ